MWSFGKKLSKDKVRTFIDLAEREGVNLGHAFENTYAYHTKVEICGSPFASIHYAVEYEGWKHIYPKKSLDP